MVVKGNMAIGNLPRFLPSIIQIVESDSKKRLLALHASKEVYITNITEVQVHLLIKFSGCNTLFSRAVGRCRRFALGTTLRTLRKCGGDHEERGRCLPRQTRNYTPFQIFASTTCKPLPQQ